MKILSVLELLLLAAVWGASFLFTRIAVPVLNPVWLIELRVLIAGVALGILLIRLKLLPELRRNWLPLLVIGAINCAMPFLLFALAALYLPAGFLSILNATAPLMSIAIAFVWFKEKLTYRESLGSVVGLIGVAVLVGWTSLPFDAALIGATVAALVASLMYAIAALYTREKLVGVSPMTIAAGSQLSAALLILPLTPFFLPQALPTLEVWAVVLALALLSSALAYVLYFHLISSIGINKALSVTYLIPLFAMFWGAIFLDESITLSMIGGCGLILTGVAIALSR